MASKRQRGVRVSPVKLQHALAESGLKTQTAVAERIADLEQLESAPRGLVNKVFRGEPVDPRSVERIASALGVNAWTLYVASDDPILPSHKHASQPVDTELKRPWLTRRTIWVSALFMMLPVAWAFLSSVYNAEQKSPPSTSVPSPSEDRTTQPTVIVLPIDTPNNLSITQTLSEKLNTQWRTMPNSSRDNNQQPDAQNMLRQNIVDRVIEGRVVTQGRWLGITLFLHRVGNMQAIWQGVLPVHASIQHLDLVLSSAAETITGEQALPSHALEAQVKYLIGREFLDRERTEPNIRRALNEFESALRIDPGYVNAYVGLCEALIMEQIRTGDVARLTEAGTQCDKALALDHSNLEAHRVQAYLDRKRGRIDESMAGFTAVLERAPNHTDALLGITDVYITQYQLAQDKNAYSKALETVRQAFEQEPDFWKTAFSLARIEYFGGNLDSAINAAQHAVKADSNVLTLSNLGTFQFCQGDFSAARDAYLQVKAVAPISFVGEQQLAAVNYNLGDFQAAAQGFKTSLDLHEQSGAARDHRVWGNYADALRHAGDMPAATASYAQAISLAEKAISEGDGNPQHAIAKAYYYEMLSLTDPQQTSQLATLAELETLSETADPIYLMFLAIIYQNRELHQQAEAFRALASEGCPGIAISPDYVIGSR